MTGWHISVGYISGESCEHRPDAAWSRLSAATEALRNDTGAIVEEARRFNAPETCSRGCCSLEGMAEMYRSGNNDATLSVVEPHSNRPGQIVQLASGDDRGLKEHVRRAFCRLLIQAMHRDGIEVNLTVV